jgi:hypothetical protein
VDTPRIISHPGDDVGDRISDITVTYIGASYIKFVEAAGVRVIPPAKRPPPRGVRSSHTRLYRFLYSPLFPARALHHATDNPISWFYVTTVWICKCFIVLLNCEFRSITKSLRITECFLSILKTREYPSLLVWLWNPAPVCLVALLPPQDGMAPWLTLARSLGHDWLTTTAALEQVPTAQIFF